MALLNSSQISLWIETSLENSGFQKLEGDALKAWRDTVLHGKNSMPPGFFGLLWERLTGKSPGKHKERVGLALEDELLEQICHGRGFEHIEGLFILHGSKISVDFATGVVNQVIDRIQGFHSSKIQIAARDLDSALEKAFPPSPDFPAKQLLKDVYQDAFDRQMKVPFALSPTDLFEIGHPQLFRTPADRTFYRRMMSGALGITPWATGVFTLKEETTMVVAHFGEPQILPLGGYDSLATKGNISSLVPSELGFIDEEMEVDLFDYKYCENQLLYFKRDEGAVFRIRRDLVVRLPLTPFFEHERHLGMLFAWCLVLSERVIETFMKDAVRIYFEFPGFQPTAFAPACAFFRFFLQEKGLTRRIFLSSPDELPADFQSSRVQAWVLGPVPINDLKFVPLEFPQTDEFAAAEPEDQERRLGAQVVLALKRMIGDADS